MIGAFLALGYGCGPYGNPAGAKQVAYEAFSTIYYQVNKDRTKAFLFFSQPKSVIVGMSLSVKWDNEAEKYAVSFGGVRDTASNRARYGPDKMLGAVFTNGLWMKEFDIGVGTNGKPGDQFWMYYVSKTEVWGIRIPYRGIKE